MVEMREVFRFYGDKRALGPVSLSIERGSTVGFLGLNGVGKSTLLRILAGDLRPSSGSARVDGIDVLEAPGAVRTKVGYLPESPPLYLDMTVGDYLAFAGRIRGLDASAVERRVREAEEATQLAHKHDDPIRTLSHGYRQRCGVAQAIVHEPELLVLDEPTNGLDPVQIREMRELIGGLRETHTILISSHILTEISETCDQILVLDAGEIVASGTERDLSERVLRSSDVVVEARLRAGEGAGAADAVVATLARVPGVVEARVERVADTVTFRVRGERDVRADVCRSVVEAGHDVVRLDRASRELEEIFVQLVAGVPS